MQVKKLKFRQACLIGAFMFFSIAAQGQSFLHPGVTFDLSFPAGSNVLEVTYDNNRLEISGLNEFISYNRSSIQRGSSHLAIIAYIKPEQKDNIYAVNRASVLGSVVRSYIKTRHGLNNLSFTFVIKDTEASSNIVKVDYRPFPVRAYENQDIFYTLKPAYKELVFAMANYREIPFESVMNQKELQRLSQDRSDYEVIDASRVEELLKRVNELEKRSVGTVQGEIAAKRSPEKKVDNSAKESKPAESEEELTERIVAKLVKALSQAESSKTPTVIAENQTPVSTNENSAGAASSGHPAANVIITHQPARLAKEGETERSQQQVNKRESQVNQREESGERQQHIQQNREQRAKREKGLYLPVAAIKTNLLGFAGVIPPSTITDPIFNLSAELFFAKRFSLMAEVFKAPIADNTDINSQDWYKVSGAILEGRLYFGKAGLFKGLFAGVYGLYGDFDIRDISVDEKGKTGSYTGAGLSVGYALPLYRGFTLEAGIRAGYRSDKYDTYVVNNGGFYISESLTNSEFGLTNYNIGISYRFGSYKRPGIR
jgi:hypothetical protein